jgi:hypothetical protein
MQSATKKQVSEKIAACTHGNASCLFENTSYQVQLGELYNLTFTSKLPANKG